MASIKILSQNLQNQIAAGEVVERPASVVKELVENSLDAGADRIIIELKNGGRDLIRIIDNGRGMNTHDAELATERYATSKIASLEDFSNLATFGFRGEALASISSISDFQLKTKPAEKISGTLVSLSSGRDKSVTDIGCAEGTEIIIKDIFKNIPARLKYLKSATTEFNYILRKIQNLALVNTGVFFRLIHNERTVLELSASENNMLDRIYSVLGKEYQSNLLPVNLKRPEIIIKGYLAKPVLARANRKQQFLFVNKRDIVSSLISASVQEAYKSLLAHGRYPVFVLDIEITSDLIDVNVHPRKEEVRFLNQGLVYRLVRNICEDALRGEHSAPVIEHTNQSFRPQFGGSPNIARAFIPRDNQPVTSIPVAINFTKEVLRSESQTQSEMIEDQPSYRIIGQLHNSYILVEREDFLEIFDQHAAHERIRYENLMNNYKNNDRIAQKLLIPQAIELSISEKSLINEHLGFLNTLGFEISSDFLIHEIPLILIDEDPQILIRSLIDDILREGGPAPDQIDEYAEEVITYLSCRKAKKFGDILSLSEMEKLYCDWQACLKKDTCPHGRNISYRINNEELKKKVGR